MHQSDRRPRPHVSAAVPVVVDDDRDRWACDACGAHAFLPGPCSVCGRGTLRRLVQAVGVRGSSGR